MSNNLSPAIKRPTLFFTHKPSFMKQMFSLFIALLFIGIAVAQNVGIGTSTPQTKLHILSSSDEALRLDATSPYLSLYSSGVYKGYFWKSPISIELGSAAGSDLPITFAPNGYQLMYVGINGNVGIGTITPNALLTVGPSLAGTALSTTLITNAGTLGNTSGDILNLASFGYTASVGNHISLGIHALRKADGNDWSTSAIGLLFDVDNTSPVNNAQIWMAANGNVGIGTSTPGAKLEVAGQIKIIGGLPGAGKVLTSDASGLASWSSTGHFIGESYGGGIVFWVDAIGQHGLIAATANQSTGIVWWNGTNTTTNAVRNGVSAGMHNTERIIASQGVGSYAAQICSNYQAGNYGDWYLPSLAELILLYPQKTVVGGFSNGYYWSSTEYNNSSVWAQSFGADFQPLGDKNTTAYVRAIRAF
jgi:hypothetical protein